MLTDRCYYYVKMKSTGEFERVPNSVCFADMYHCYSISDGYLYITDFRDKDTEKYITRLCLIINKLTKCRRVKINNTEYIKFKLFDKCYDKNLFLLNFIRYLWYIPYCNNRTERQCTFFKKLYTEEYTDPISILTYANKEMCTGLFYSQGHSNMGNYNKMKIQTIDSFTNFKWVKHYENFTTNGTKDFQYFKQ